MSAHSAVDAFSRVVLQYLHDPNVIRILQASIGLVIIGAVFRFLAQAFSGSIQEVDLRYRIRKFIRLIGYLMMALLVVIVFSDRISRLTVIFGVVGAGVAFALQEVIVSMAGWVAISLGQFYTTGDRVQLGGIMGDVIDISPLRTTLMECGGWVKADLYNGRIVRIANSFVFKEPVYNYSGDFPFVWDELRVPIRHGSDHALARSIFTEALDEVTSSYIHPAREKWKRMTHKYLIEHARIEPMVTLMITDNWLEFTLRYVVDYKQRRYVQDNLHTLILDRIAATDQRVQIASTTVEIVALPHSDPSSVEAHAPRQQPIPPLTF
jgi:small-conductance mechanosensitive channel